MQVNSTFANFVNSELVGLVLDILNGREVKVTRNAAILLIQELHRLSCNVDHACREKNTPQRQTVSACPFFNVYSPNVHKDSKHTLT